MVWSPRCIYACTDVLTGSTWTNSYTCSTTILSGFISKGLWNWEVRTSIQGRASCVHVNELRFENLQSRHVKVAIVHKGDDNFATWLWSSMMAMDPLKPIRTRQLPSPSSWAIREEEPWTSASGSSARNNILVFLISPKGLKATLTPKLHGLSSFCANNKIKRRRNKLSLFLHIVLYILGTNKWTQSKYCINTTQSVLSTAHHLSARTVKTLDMKIVSCAAQEIWFILQDMFERNALNCLDAH